MSQLISVTVRFPAAIHAALHEACAQDDRSFNGEVVALLRAEMMRRGLLKS